MFITTQHYICCIMLPVPTEYAKAPYFIFLKHTCFWHALCSLHPGAEHLFSRNKENVVWRLSAVNNFQLINQKVHTTVCVLLPHLQGHMVSKADVLIGKFKIKLKKIKGKNINI